MKPVQTLFALLVAIAAAPTLAADVGVSISVGQPGFYGRIDVGGYSAPQLLYPRPVVIQRVPDDRPPVYLRVPPGHAKNWARHCHAYNACGERVFFVRDDWYQREYVPHHEEHRRGWDERREERRDERREERHDDRRDMRDERRNDRRDDHRDNRRDDRQNDHQDRRDERRDHER